MIRMYAELEIQTSSYNVIAWPAYGQITAQQAMLTAEAANAEERRSLAASASVPPTRWHCQMNRAHAMALRP